MTDDEIIAVVKAHKEGKKIEWQRKGRTKKEWSLSMYPTWNFISYNYRVKVEPKVVYINEFKDGSSHTYISKQLALEAPQWIKPARVAVKYIEVIEEDSE